MVIIKIGWYGLKVVRLLIYELFILSNNRINGFI